MKNPPKPQTRTGNRPQRGQHIVTFPGWELWAITLGKDQRWLVLKLWYTEGSLPGKANYWLHWGTHEYRFARYPDVKRLALDRPALYSQLLRWLDTRAPTLEGARDTLLAERRANAVEYWRQRRQAQARDLQALGIEPAPEDAPEDTTP